MSLLTQASLVLTPNAYKANKLYSIIPSSGSGDMTTTRATTATRVNSSGLVENVATGIPRVDYTGGFANILLEPQRTNRLLNSATVVTQTITTTAVANTLSFYGTGTITLSGTFSGLLAGTGASNRVSLTFTPTAGSLVLTVNGTCTNGQLETGSYATSYIPTTTSTVTRNRDIMSRSNIYTNGLITSAGGTWFLDQSSTSGIGNGSQEYGICLFTFGTNSLIISPQSNGTLLFRKFTSSSQTINQTIVNSNVARTKVIIRWNVPTGVITIFFNGALAYTFTSQTFVNYESLFLSDQNAGGTLETHKVYSTMLFPTPLTDAECLSLTTL